MDQESDSSDSKELALRVFWVTGDREERVLEETTLWWPATKEVTVWAVAHRLGERWVASATWRGSEVQDLNTALEGADDPEAVLYVRRDEVAHAASEKRELAVAKSVAMRAFERMTKSATA